MTKGLGIGARACLFSLWAMLLPSLVQAQATVTPEDEYKDLIRVSQDIQPLGEHPFGAHIGLYGGSLSFAQTDVSLAGNGPLLQFGRDYAVQGDRYNSRAGGALFAFGDWTLAVPRIETLTAKGWSSRTGSIEGWNVNSPDVADIHARCKQFNEPLTLRYMNQNGYFNWLPATWWHGYQLIVPGHGSQDLLSNDATDKATYPAVTKDHWRISCITETQTANGEPGDGFIAQAPNGTRYWFNELVYGLAPTINRPVSSDPLSSVNKQTGGVFASGGDMVSKVLSLLTGAGSAYAMPIMDQLDRQAAWMLVTRIEDRFGNSLTYHYDATGHLTGISASDGRALTVQYTSFDGAQLVHSVTLQPASGAARMWVYGYSGLKPHIQLVSVTQPDGSQWHFDLTAFNREVRLDPQYQGNCYVPAPVDTFQSWTASMTHPSGLTGTFTVGPHKHGRADVPRECRGGANGNEAFPGSYALQPNAWYSLTLTQRTLAGAGIKSSDPEHPDRQTWAYSYSDAYESWAVDCDSGCLSSISTTVVKPDGNSVQSTFSNLYGYTESQLQKTEYFKGNGDNRILRRTVTNTYAAPTTGPWPLLVGDNLQTRINAEQTEWRAPLSRTVLTQDGDSYTWQAEAFNTYAQVTKTKRFSSVNTTGVEQQTSYVNDVPHWVLGLPLQVDNLSTGATVDKYVYDMTDVTLKERWHFGQKLMTYAFNGAGQLASFTDGKGHNTTLGSYKRGIPRAIGYPDGTAQSLVVDDFGQIASITDQAGSKTSYGYDSAGRLTSIAYPSGDEQAWLPKTFAYAWVSGAEYGVPAGHWRRTTAQGSARSLTYFDALLRPVRATDYIAGVSGSDITRRTAYNWKGQTTFASYPASGFPTQTSTLMTTGTSSTYDALGRLTQVQQAAEAPIYTVTSTTAYLSGARRQVTDPKGNVTTSSYQVFDQPSYDAVIKVQAPDGLTQTISRDLYGKPTTITQSGVYGTQSLSVSKQFFYDSQQRLCRTYEPESGNTVMAYDAANNLAWSAAGLAISGSGCGQEQVVDPARTKRSYDAMNRLLTVAPPVGTQTTAYTYDTRGNLASASSGISYWWANYDTLGHITGEALWLSGQNAWGIGYAYDAYGHVSQVTYPDGLQVAYAPDALGRATQVGSYVSGIGYYPNGAVAYATLGDGSVFSTEQNDRRLLSNLSYGHAGVPRIGQDLSYDKNGNITQVQDLMTGHARDKTFSYDALNRLTTATGLWGTQSYSYDPLNNIRTRSDNGQVSTYHYRDTTDKQLSSISGATSASFSYDLRGNTINRNGVALNFDQSNQLLGIPGQVSYAYDAAGRRVQKKPVGGWSTYSFYNHAGQLMYQREPGLAKSTSFVYLGHKLVGDNEETALDSVGAITLDASPNNGDYTVSWGAVPSATTYTLQQRAGSGSWVTVSAGAATSHAFSGVAGGSYTYQVRACAGSTCGPWSLSGTLGVRPALATVTTPAGTINGSYEVSWSTPASSTAFDVQERLGSGAWQTIANDTIATSITRPGTASGSYTYQVSALNGYGTRGWAPSTAVNVDITYGVVPTTPASFSVPASSSTGSASLSWSAAALTTRYVVQQSSNGGTSWAGLYNAGATSTTVTGLANGSYSYRLQACNTYGCSGWRAGDQTLLVLHPPAAPASMTLPATSSGSVAISWAASSTATSYTLQHANYGVTGWSTIYTGSATQRTQQETVTGAWIYQVKACNAAGCSAYKLNSSGVLLTIPPASAPSLSVPTSNHNGSYTVSWGAVSGATSYTVHEHASGAGWHALYSGSSRSKALSGKTNSTWSYRVQACNAGGCGPWAATRAVVVTRLPSTASGVSITTTGPYYKPVVHVSWNASSYASSYKLEETLPGQSPTQSNVGNVTTSTAGLILVDGEVRYRVQACNAVGCAPWSGYKSIYLNSGSGGGGKWLQAPAPTPAPTTESVAPSAAPAASATTQGGAA